MSSSTQKEVNASLTALLASANRSADASQKEASKLRQELDELRHEHVTAVTQHKNKTAEWDSYRDRVTRLGRVARNTMEAIKLDFNKQKDEIRSLREEKRVLERTLDICLERDKKDERELERLFCDRCRAQSER